MANFKVGQDYIVDKNGYTQSYPVGSIVIIMSSTIPDGWLLCDGSPINTYTYQELHKNITNTYGGTAYSAGTTDQSGVSTTFNLPALVVNATYNPSGRYVTSLISSEPSYPSTFTHNHAFYSASTTDYSTPTYNGVHNHSAVSIGTSAETANHNHAGLAQTGVNNVTQNAATSRYSSANNTTQYSNDYVHDHGGAFTVNGFNTLSTYGYSHNHSVTVHGAADAISHAHTIAHSTNVTVAGITRQGISFGSTDLPLSKEAYFIIKY